MGNKELKRDPAIELVRLMACLIVIGCHTVPAYQLTENHWDGTRLLLAMFFADGVGIFWMIGGAFLFNGADYKRLLLRSVKNVVLPAVIVGGIYFFFGRYISGETNTLAESMKHSSADYYNLIQSQLRLSNGISGYNQIWYVYIYCLLIICFPLIKSFVDYLDQSTKHLMLWSLITGAFLILNDVTRNELLNFSHSSVNALAPAVIIAIIGHYIYRYRSKFRHAYWTIISVVLFLICNLLREVIQQNRVLKYGSAQNSIMFWFSSPGIFCAALIMIFGISVVKNKNATKINRLICYLASYTYPVYLLHLLVISWLSRKKIIALIETYTINRFSNIVGEVLYSTLVIGITFLTAFISFFFYRVIKRVAISLLDKIKGAVQIK